jgi:hypothetical protein
MVSLDRDEDVSGVEEDNGQPKARRLRFLRGSRFAGARSAGSSEPGQPSSLS